jgi:hypothetical protein
MTEQKTYEKLYTDQLEGQPTNFVVNDDQSTLIMAFQSDCKFYDRNKDMTFDLDSFFSIS